MSIRSSKRLVQITNLCEKIVHDSNFKSKSVGARRNGLRSFFIMWVFLRLVFFKTPRKNTTDFRNHGLLFTHFITWVKKVRGVFKINVILNSNSEISFEAPYVEALERYKWSITSRSILTIFPHSTTKLSNAEIVIKWPFDKVFSGSLKTTKAIHSALKAIHSASYTILCLAGVEVSISGSVYANAKHAMLRDKIVEQYEAFIKVHITENQIFVPPFVTTNLLKSADIAEKKDWKISITNNTTWRAYQKVVKEFRNDILPLWESLIRIVGKGADGKGAGAL